MNNELVRLLKGAPLEQAIRLLLGGYTDEVRALTRAIQGMPDAVEDFKGLFDALYDHAQGSGLNFDWVAPASHQTLMDRIAESHECMERFLEGNQSRQGTYFNLSNHGHEVTCELGWNDRAAGAVVWDRWTTECDDPVMVYVSMGFIATTSRYRCQAQPSERAEPPLYRYHPERFKAYRLYPEYVGKLYRQKVSHDSGILTIEQLNAVIANMVEELNRLSMKYPRRYKDDHPAPSLVMDAEMALATAYGRFVQAGRQIMDFPPALMEMLANTDVDDIPLDSIKMPYSSQYLHFGPQADLELAPGWLVDGAYVEYRGVAGDIRFTVTAVPANHTDSALWYVLPEAEFSQDFIGDYRSMDLATAMDMVFSARLAALKQKLASAGGDITETIQMGLAKDGAALPDGVSVVDVSPSMATQRLDLATSRYPIYQAAIRLVVNALCYVSAYPDDIDTVWPAGAPDSLTQKADSGRGKESQRAQSKLAALGYVPVHICGRNASKQREVALGGSTSTSRTSTHWRRGHWRNQPYGTGRALRKLIWMMPVMVGGRNNEEPDAGHLYLVS